VRGGNQVAQGPEKGKNFQLLSINRRGIVIQKLKERAAGWGGLKYVLGRGGIFTDKGGCSGKGRKGGVIKERHESSNK